MNGNMTLGHHCRGCDIHAAYEIPLGFEEVRRARAASSGNGPGPRRHAREGCALKTREAQSPRERHPGRRLDGSGRSGGRKRSTRADSRPGRCRMAETFQLGYRGSSALWSRSDPSNTGPARRALRARITSAKSRRQAVMPPGRRIRQTRLSVRRPDGGAKQREWQTSMQDRQDAGRARPGGSRHRSLDSIANKGAYGRPYSGRLMRSFRWCCHCSTRAGSRRRGYDDSDEASVCSD